MRSLSVGLVGVAETEYCLVTVSHVADTGGQCDPESRTTFVYITHGTGGPVAEVSGSSCDDVTMSEPFP